MTRDLFGLKVEIEDSLVEEFASLRSLIEPIMRKYKTILSEKKHNTVDSNFVKVPGNNPYYLTFCIAGESIFLGIYNKNTKAVYDSCNWADIKSLGNSEMNRLGFIIENYIKNNQKLPSLNALEISWRQELIRRKEKEIEEAKKVPEKPASYLSFESVVQRACAAKPPPGKSDLVKPSRNSMDER